MLFDGAGSWRFLRAGSLRVNNMGSMVFYVHLTVVAAMWINVTGGWTELQRSVLDYCTSKILSRRQCYRGPRSKQLRKTPLAVDGSEDFEMGLPNVTATNRGGRKLSRLFPTGLCENSVLTIGVQKTSSS
nr:hypothetical protein CFP56_31758 [Quercus suber]